MVYFVDGVRASKLEWQVFNALRWSSAFFPFSIKTRLFGCILFVYDFLVLFFFFLSKGPFHWFFCVFCFPYFCCFFFFWPYHREGFTLTKDMGPYYWWGWSIWAMGSCCGVDRAHTKPLLVASLSNCFLVRSEHLSYPSNRNTVLLFHPIVLWIVSTFPWCV